MDNLPSLTDLAALNARLAHNNARVADFLDGLTLRVDQLIDATLAEDWDEVKRQSQWLAHCSQLMGYTELAASAERVCDVIHSEPQPAAVKRELVQLISRCGTVKSHEAPKTTS